MVHLPENRFGALAVGSRFITPEQLEECLALQKQYLQADRPVPRLGGLLVMKGYMTPAQVRAVLVGQQRLAEENELFGEIAVRWRFCTAPQIENALRQQRAMDIAGAPHMRLGELLVGQGVLKPHQVQAILSAQRKQPLSCPACGARFNVRGAKPGLQVNCPGCGAINVFGQAPKAPSFLPGEPLEIPAVAPDGEAGPQAPVKPAASLATMPQARLVRPTFRRAGARPRSPVARRERKRPSAAVRQARPPETTERAGSPPQAASPTRPPLPLRQIPTPKLTPEPSPLLPAVREQRAHPASPPAGALPDRVRPAPLPELAPPARTGPSGAVPRTDTTPQKSPSPRPATPGEQSSPAQAAADRAETGGQLTRYQLLEKPGADLAQVRQAADEMSRELLEPKTGAREPEVPTRGVATAAPAETQSKPLAVVGPEHVAPEDTPEGPPGKLRAPEAEGVRRSVASGVAAGATSRKTHAGSEGQRGRVAPGTPRGAQFFWFGATAVLSSALVGVGLYVFHDGTRRAVDAWLERGQERDWRHRPPPPPTSASSTATATAFPPLDPLEIEAGAALARLEKEAAAFAQMELAEKKSVLEKYRQLAEDRRFRGTEAQHRAIRRRHETARLVAEYERQLVEVEIREATDASQDRHDFAGALARPEAWARQYPEVENLHQEAVIWRQKLGEAEAARERLLAARIEELKAGGQWDEARRVADIIRQSLTGELAQKAELYHRQIAQAEQAHQAELARKKAEEERQRREAEAARLIEQLGREVDRKIAIFDTEGAMRAVEAAAGKPVGTSHQKRYELLQADVARLVSLKKETIRRVAAGAFEKFYLDFEGHLARIAAASPEGLTLRVGGGELFVGWAQIKGKELVRLVAASCREEAEKASEDLAALAFLRLALKLNKSDLWGAQDNLAAAARGKVEVAHLQERLRALLGSGTPPPAGAHLPPPPEPERVRLVEDGWITVRGRWRLDENGVIHGQSHPPHLSTWCYKKQRQFQKVTVETKGTGTYVGLSFGKNKTYAIEPPKEWVKIQVLVRGGEVEFRVRGVLAESICNTSNVKAPADVYGEVRLRVLGEGSFRHFEIE